MLTFNFEKPHSIFNTLTGYVKNPQLLSWIFGRIHWEVIPMFNYERQIYMWQFSGAQDQEYLEKKKPVFLNMIFNLAFLEGKKMPVYLINSNRNPEPWLYAKDIEEISEIVKKLDIEEISKIVKKHGVRYLICQIRDK